MKNKQTYEIVLTGLGMALVFVATMFIKVPNALDGYFNLGDGFILLFASFLNPFESFLIGGLGSALADVAGGYGHYFFFTKYILKGSWIVAASEILANVVQGAAGIVIALVAYPMVKKIVQDKLN